MPKGTTRRTSFDRRGRLREDRGRPYRERSRSAGPGGISLVFRKFAELQSVRQVLLWFSQENVLVPAIV